MRFCFVKLTINKSIINFEKEQHNCVLIKQMKMLRLYGNGVIIKLRTKSQAITKYIAIYYS